MRNRKIALMLLVLIVSAVSAQSVVINEFVASNREGLLDGDGNSSDWIELRNETRETVSLSGWCLTDDAGDLTKWAFPAGTDIPARGYLVVFASSRDVNNYVDSLGYLHTTFALNKDGEFLALVRANGSVAHVYAPEFPEQEADYAYGVWESGLRYFAVPTPGEDNEQPFSGFARTSHSHERGFYNDPFELHIACTAPDALIRYTLDGSEPSQENGHTYDPTVPIPIITTTVVRSVAYTSDWRSGGVTTQSYVFVDDVAQQPADPPGWPDHWGSEPAQYSGPAIPEIVADYEMDPRVVNTTLPGYSVQDALLDIPSVSIAMEPVEFIGPADGEGLWSNPLIDTEYKCSMEYIPVDDSEDDFQEYCKVENHGFSSRFPQRMQKHNFRLTFTSEYGAARLRHPLFPDSPVDTFNQLILRAFSTDSWALVSWSSDTRYRPNDSQYMRDVWMKESLLDMGQPSSYGRYVHVYVNGLYFGLFDLTESVDEAFCEEHFGGEREDWTVAKDFEGVPACWSTVRDTDVSTSAGYEQIQDCIDIENFADYMLLHFYADAEDWPHHNGIVANNAVSGDGKMRFFVWDQAIVLDQHGRAASRINNGNGAGALFQNLRNSEAFRLLFADRVYKHCFNDGALSLSGSQNRYLEIANEIDKAIVAESARWGDVQMSTPYGNSIRQPNPLNDIDHRLYPPAPHGPDYYFTREESWVVERDNVIDNYIPAIHDTSNNYAIINVLRSADLYPDIDPPVYSINGVEQHGGPVEAGDQLTLSNPHGTGTVYYTLDGSDPHVPSESGVLSSQTLVPEDAPKKILVPTGDIGFDWTGGNEPYADATWTHGTPVNSSGTGGVGYERSNGYQSYISYDVQTQMSFTMESCYIRIPFTVSAADLANFNFLTLRIRYDDGFVAYLNGTRIAAANATASPAWNSGATTSHDDNAAVAFETIDCSDFVDQLHAGDNILAIHGLNYRATSSDFLISVELIAGENFTSMEGISDSTFVYEDPIDVTETTRIKSRLWRNGQWSALNEAVFSVD